MQSKLCFGTKYYFQVPPQIADQFSTSEKLETKYGVPIAFYIQSQELARTDTFGSDIASGFLIYKNEVSCLGASGPSDISSLREIIPEGTSKNSRIDEQKLDAWKQEANKIPWPFINLK